MKIWIERAAAAFRWAWDAVAWRVKWVLNRLDSMYYDPPPLSYKRMLYGFLVLLLTVFVTYHLGRIAGRGGHVSVQTFTSEVGLSFPEISTGYLLPEPQPLPEVVTRLPSVPSVEVVCHDMSDTPQCEPVKSEVTEVIPAPIVEAPVVKKATVRKNRTVRRKPQPYQTVWGF